MMKRAWLRRHGKTSLELIEEAFHVLRRAPASTLVSYYAGTLPFCLAMLYFWSEMSRSPFARGRLAGGALGVALLFVWMKVWQTIFAGGLRSHATGEAPTPWSVRRILRVAAQQAIAQPSGLFALALALVTLFSFGWVFAFYQNLTVLSDGTTADLKPLLRRARQQSAMWPGQNHLMLLSLAGFGFFVWINWMTVAYFGPQLLKTFLGIETMVTQSPFALLNTTFLTATLALTYLCVDPLVKAAYLLRCFYGESLQSGEDLKAELRQFAKPVAAMAACLACALTFACSTAVVAATESPDSPPTAAASEALSPPVERASSTKPASSAVAPAELDRAIDEVIQQRKYTWRMPREKAPKEEAEEGMIARFLHQAWATLKEWLIRFLEWIGDLLERLFRGRGSRHGGPGWITALQGLLFVVIAAVVSLLAILVYRLVRNRRQKPEAVASEAFQPVPDVADENVGADQLPEDAWMKLGRELLERGELRLALRAFYLSGLAHLAGRNLVTLAKFKSNLDYQRELRRRGHSFPELLDVFGETVIVFDRVWYGLHAVDADLIGQFAGNVERIKTTA
jgi:hypothetical protein